MRNLFLSFIILVGSLTNVFSQDTFYSQGTGNFDAITWQTVPGGGGTTAIGTDLTDGDNSFVIQQGHTVDVNLDIDIDDLTVDSAGTLTIGDGTAAYTLTVNGSIAVGGATGTRGLLNTDAGAFVHTLNLAGDITIASSGASNRLDFYNSATSAVNLVYFGTAAKVISTIDANWPEFNSVNVSHGGALIVAGEMNIRGDFLADGAGTSVTTSNSFIPYQDFTISGGATYLANSGYANFRGTTAQTLTFDSGSVEFAALFFDNGGSGNVKTINGDLIVDGEFRFLSDAFITSTNRNHVFHGGNFRIFNSASDALDFNGGSVTFDDQTNARTIYFDGGDLSVSLGTAALIIDGFANIQTGDSLLVDSNVLIKEGYYLVLNGEATGVRESGLVDVSGTHTLTMEENSNFYIRGVDNFPVSFDNYAFGNNTLVRYDRDWDQTVRGLASDGDTIKYNRLYTSETDNATARTKQMAPGEPLYTNSYLQVDNGSNFVLSTGVHTIKGSIIVDDGASILGGDSASVIWSVDDANASLGDAADLSSIFEFKSFTIVNENPTAIRTRFINDSILIRDGGKFTVDNSQGDTSNYIVVDLNVHQIVAEGAAADTFLLNENVHLYTSSTDGFISNYGDVNDVALLDSLSVVRFERAGDQTIPRATYGSIQFTGSGQRYVADSLLILGDIVDQGNPIFRYGTTTGGAPLPNVCHEIKGDWILNNGSTNQLDGGTIKFTGNDQSIFGSYLPNVVYKGTGTKTIAGGQTITGDVTIDDGVTVDGTGRTINLTGNWNEMDGTFMQTTGSVVFNGGGDQEIDQQASSEFGSLTISNSGKVITNTNVTVGINVVFDNTTQVKLDISGDTLYVARDWYLRDGDSLLTDANSLLEFNGNIDQDLLNENDELQTYPTLSFTNSGRKTLSGVGT
ncbi:MAG: hypothetical protein AB8B61_06760 [Cyclobacteriaceae bacterium]